MSMAMLKRRASRWTTAAALGLATLCSPLVFSAPQVPDSAVASDTFALVNLNLQKIDPDSVEATAKAVMGPMAALATAKLADFREKYKEFTDAGAEDMIVAASGDPTGDKEPNAVAYVKFKSGTDHAAVEAKVKEESAKEAQKLGKQPEDMNLSWEGDFLVINKKGAEAPKGGDAERAKAFKDAFAAEDKALDIVIVFTDKMRKDMKDQAAQNLTQGAPPWLKEAADAATDAKAMSFGITLGASPSIDLMINAADEAGAKKLTTAASEGAKMLKEQAANMKQAGGQAAAMADSMNTLADALNAKQDGAKVTMSVDAKAIAPAVMQMGMMFGGVHRQQEVPQAPGQ